MKWYRDLIPAAPDDLNGFFAFLTVPARGAVPRTFAHEDKARRTWSVTRAAEAGYKIKRGLFESAMGLMFLLLSPEVHISQTTPHI